MKNFTTLSFILSMLSMTYVSATNPDVKEVNLDLVGLDYLTKSLGLSETLDLGKVKGKKKGGLKLASEEGEETQEAQSEENDQNDQATGNGTIKAAGDRSDYFGGHHHRGRRYGRGCGHGGYGWSDDDYSHGHRRHWRNNGLYRRAEDNLGYSHGRRYGHRGHRRHGHHFDHDDSDWSDDNNDWHGNRFHGRHGGLYRRAEEAEADYSRGNRHGHHGQRRHGRFNNHYDSDWSDDDSDWHGPRHHGRRFHGGSYQSSDHGLYRRAEGGRHIGRSRRHNSYDQLRNLFSESDYSDSDYSGSDYSSSNSNFGPFGGKKPIFKSIPKGSKH